jgi:hypothetical protein
MLVAEKRLQMAAHRLGLRVIADRHAGRVTGKYLLRPASDARCVVQILPDGSYCLTPFSEWGRRYIGSRMSFEEVESFLARCEPMPADHKEVRARRRAGQSWGGVSRVRPAGERRQVSATLMQTSQ